MADQPEILAIHHRVMNRAYEDLWQGMMKMREEQARRPAIPLTDDPDKIVAEKPAPLKERLKDYGVMRSNPEYTLGAKIDEYRQRVGMPPHLIPAHFVQEAIEAEKEFRAQMERDGLEVEAPEWSEDGLQR